MKRVSLVLTALLFALVPSFICKGQSEDFLKKVEEAEKSVRGFMGKPDLFRSQEFLAIWHKADMYADDAVAFLQISGPSRDAKFIVATAMQNLDLNNFVKFCRKIIELRKNNMIDDSVFNWSIFPNARVWDAHDPRIVSLLDDLKQYEFVTKERKAVIDLMLRGEGRADNRPPSDLPWPLR